MAGIAPPLPRPDAHLDPRRRSHEGRPGTRARRPVSGALCPDGTLARNGFQPASPRSWSPARPTRTCGAARKRLLLARHADGAALIVLDERGKHIGSEDFAQAIGSLRDGGERHLVFALGGHDGHAEQTRERARLVLSFGRLTWAAPARADSCWPSSSTAQRPSCPGTHTTASELRLPCPRLVMMPWEEHPLILEHGSPG